MGRLILSERCALAMVNWAPFPFQGIDLDLAIHTLNMLRLWTVSAESLPSTRGLMWHSLWSALRFNRALPSPFTLSAPTACLWAVLMGGNEGFVNPDFAWGYPVSLFINIVQSLSLVQTDTLNSGSSRLGCKHSHNHMVFITTAVIEVVV